MIVPILIYSLFCLMFFVFHGLFTSIVAYFHFILEHKFNSIEEWTLRNCWEILLISKGVAYFVTTRFSFIDGKYLPSFEKSTGRGPWVITFFLIFFFTFYLRWDYRPEYWKFISHHFVSYLGIIGILITDYFFLAHLKERYKLENPLLFMIAAFFIYIFSFLGTVSYQKTWDWPLFHFGVLLAFLYRNYVMGGVVYLFLLVGPLSVLFGLDPIWGDQYSLLQSSRPQVLTYLWGLFIVIFYLRFIEARKNNE